MIPYTVYFFLLIELLAVTYLDILYKKIANIWSILNITTFLIFTIIFSESYKINFHTFYFSLVFFVVGLFLFAIRIMGAGDSKYLVSFYLLVPVHLHEEAIISLLYSTCLVGGASFVYNLFINRELIAKSFQRRDLKMFRSQFGKKFAFAPVILISWVWLGWKLREKLF